ncbi:hypothetical protein N8I77_011577 [Diaporthe amygdali]|uniref:Uncharacterized protein n=1 Tax=Phomopsis amygdali TaxID=1214568 RepID=A0AAD9VYH9_PHOAM|nr:hypothetical protein N8I77_011577 [Diaporthe amygdali]
MATIISTPKAKRPSLHQITVTGQGSPEPDLGLASEGKGSFAGSIERHAAEDNKDLAVPPKLSAKARKLLKLCGNCERLRKDQRNPQGCCDCIYASGEGEEDSPALSSDFSSPLAGRSVKPVKLWCNVCTERKAQPGEDGRTRKNARHGCKDCLHLREQVRSANGSPAGSSPASKSFGATASTPGRITKRRRQPKSKYKQASQKQVEGVCKALWLRQNQGETNESVSRQRWVMATATIPSHELKDDDLDDSTVEDDPMHPPRCIPKDDPHTDFLGQPRNAEYLAMIHQNIQQWQQQPQPASLAPQPDFYDDQGQGVFFNGHGAPGAPAIPAPAIPLPVSFNNQVQGQGMQINTYGAPTAATIPASGMPLTVSSNDQGQYQSNHFSGAQFPEASSLSANDHGFQAVGPNLNNLTDCIDPRLLADDPSQTMCGTGPTQGFDYPSRPAQDLNRTQSAFDEAMDDLDRSGWHEAQPWDAAPMDCAPSGMPHHTAGPQQPGFQQPGFQQPGFQQPGFQQPGFQQPGFQQPGFQQPGFQQPGFQQPGFPPNAMQSQSPMQAPFPGIADGMGWNGFQAEFQPSPAPQPWWANPMSAAYHGPILFSDNQGAANGNNRLNPAEADMFRQHTNLSHGPAPPAASGAPQPRST